MDTSIRTRLPNGALAPTIPFDPDSPRVAACRPLEPGRQSLERYIATIFHAAYGATVMEYLPLLCSVERDSSYQAALGLRSAATGSLFCEQYLDRSAQWYVLTEFGRTVRRDRVMELGNLVSSGPGQAVWLYLLVVRALQTAGVDYLMFAANRAVMASIRRCGFDTRILCDADPARLGDRAAEWGSYYEGRPRVVLADLREAVDHGERSAPISRLWREQRSEVQSLAAAIRASRR